MPNVYDVSVRVMRRVQMKEYEPMEAEVSLKAQLAEGEDYIEAVNKLLIDAKTAVIETAIKGSAGKVTKSVEPAAAPATAAAAPAEAAPRKGRPTKAEQEAKAAAEAAKAAAAGTTDDFSTEPTPAPAPAPAAEPDEFSEFETAEAAPAAAPMTVKELQDWITANIQAKKIDVAKVKETYGKFGVTRSADTKDEDRPKIKAAIEAIIKADGK